MSSVSAPVPPSRRDGRGPCELRGKELRTSELTAFDGSAWYAQGGTVVVAAVSGPVAARQESHRACAVRVHVRRARREPSAGGAERLLVAERRAAAERADGALSRLLADCAAAAVPLDRFPRLVLEAHVTVLADDGAREAVAVNALMCALLDAGVPCRTTVAAVAVAACAEETQGPMEFLLDPTRAEEETEEAKCCATATFVLANPACGGGVLASRVESRPRAANERRISGKEMGSMLALVERAATTVFEFFRNCNVPLE